MRILDFIMRKQDREQINLIADQLHADAVMEAQQTVNARVHLNPPPTAWKYWTHEDWRAWANLAYDDAIMVGDAMEVDTHDLSSLLDRRKTAFYLQWDNGTEVLWTCWRRKCRKAVRRLP